MILIFEFGMVPTVYENIRYSSLFINITLVVIRVSTSMILCKHESMV
jgi:hypothetical protein